MENLFVPLKFTTYVQLAPSELDDEFETAILTKLRAAYEGVCTRFGYIREGSVQIVRRSLGQFMKAHFNGYIRFNVMAKAEVCNPIQGMVVEAVVKNKNQLGILAESSITVGATTIPVLDIIVPRRSAGIASEVDVDTVQIGDAVHVEILGKRYQLKDKKISIIGKVVLASVTDTAAVTEPVKTKVATAAAATAATTAATADGTEEEEEYVVDEDVVEESDLDENALKDHDAEDDEEVADEEIEDDGDDEEEVEEAVGDEA